MITEPYKLVTYEYTTRNKFQIEQGYHPFNSLYIIQSGAFVSESNGVVNEYKSGDIVFFPTDMKFHRHIIEPLVFHFILFERNKSSGFDFELPAGKLEFRDKNRLQSTLITFNRIAAVQRDFNNIQQHLLNDIIYQYYIENQAIPDYANKEFDDTALIAAVNYMRNNISSKLSLNQLADMIGISPSGLIWKFKTQLGTSPINYLLSLRIQLAKHLLSESDLSIQKIADKCGFDNSYYFSSFFKKRIGMSPSVYRDSHRI